jgi:hypothetical protein
MMKEEEEGGRRMAAAVYPNVYAIQSCSLWKTLIVLQFTKSYKLIVKLKIVEKKMRNKKEIFLKQHKKFEI